MTTHNLPQNGLSSYLEDFACPLNLHHHQNQ